MLECFPIRYEQCVYEVAKSEAFESRMMMKERIQRAAADVYNRDGLSGLTMRAIAREAGITAGAIYTHYRDREAILAELWHNRSTELEKAFEQPIVSTDPNERILELADRYARWALADPELIELMFRNHPENRVLIGGGAGPEVVDNSAIRVLVDEVRNCMESGAWRQDDVFETVIAVWAQGYGILSLYSSGRISVTEPELVALMRASMMRLIKGLQCPIPAGK
jgi:AcrR family transcriptional regulator